MNKPKRPAKATKAKPRPKGKGKAKDSRLVQAQGDTKLLHETERRLEKALDENSSLRTEVAQLRAKIEAKQEPPTMAPMAQP